MATSKTSKIWTNRETTSSSVERKLLQLEIDEVQATDRSPNRGCFLFEVLLFNNPCFTGRAVHNWINRDHILAFSLAASLLEPETKSGQLCL